MLFYCNIRWILYNFIDNRIKKQLCAEYPDRRLNASLLRLMPERRRIMSKKTLFIAKQLAVLMAFLVICSCSSAPMKGYTGPDLPTDQTALVKAVRATNINTCDGLKLSGFQNEVIVLPGAHNIEVTWRGGIESYSNEVILVTFKAEAGHTYEISAESVPGARWDVFTTDKTTGTRVGNNRPSTKSDKDNLAYIDRQMQFGTNNEALWNERGMTLRRMKRYEEAIKAYDKAIEIKPDYVEAWNNKGAALSYINKQEEALKYYDKAIEIKSDYALAWNNKGSGLADLKRYEEALKAYDKAIEIKPDYALAWNNKGRSLSYLGKNEEALKCYEKAKELGFKP
jgi:Flp pilus assembly protein TadD